MRKKLTPQQEDAIQLMQTYDGVKVTDARKKRVYEHLVEMGLAMRNKMWHELEWVDVYSLNKKGYSLFMLAKEKKNGYKAGK